MLTVEMLPAEHGDCLWVQYGDPGRPSVLLIDGGTGATATTTSPVLTPTRTLRSRWGWARFRSRTDSRMASPQRTARSGSSSWVEGTPNTAMAPSPMNLSRVPPNRSTSSRSLR